MSCFKVWVLVLSLFHLVWAEQPNIVFIFADDHTWSGLGALDNSPVQTPNLDRLKKEGAYFRYAYNMGSYSAAVCIASRTMLVTGQTLWNANKYAKEKGDLGQNTWPEWMKSAGYETYMAGKWHVNSLNPKDIFDHTQNIRKGMPKADGSYDRKYKLRKPDGWAYDKTKKGYWDGGQHWSEVLADDGEDFLELASRSEKPFFMYLAFNAPHDPRQSPKKFVDMYSVNEIKVQDNFLPEYPYNKQIGAPRNLRDERLAPFPRTKHSVKVNLQEYYALITHMDAQIGRILDAVEATGKADNTYFFFTADHGLAVGDHGFMGKQNMYDASMRVPMLVAGPGIEAGKTIDAPIYLQDVMATSLEIAGIQKPSRVQFNSMLPLATGKTTKSSYDAIYGAYFAQQRMYRTEKYKLIIYPDANVVRLFDMVNDPLEMNDLAAGENKPVKIMNQLFNEFKELQKQMNDKLDVSKAYSIFMADSLQI